MNCEIILTDEKEFETEEFGIGISECKYSLSIFVKEKSLKEQLKNKDMFKKCIDFEKEVINDIVGITDNTKNELKYIEDNFDTFFEKSEYIRFNFSEKNIKDFIKENPIVLQKKIVIGNPLEIKDYDRLMYLMEEYKDIKDKIYVILVGNDSYISLDDCFKTMNKIKKEAESIKKLNLSPIETVMYVYDYVRNRVYKYEDKDELSFKSRDLSEVLFGDKIVCEGYANMFYTLLNYLDFENNYVVRLYEPEGKKNRRGHARNVVYIKDDKYDIDGVYYFDPTWDSKKEENDNSYLRRYKYFARTKEYMDKNNIRNLKEEYFDNYSFNIYNKIEDIVKFRFSKLKDYIGIINHMGVLAGERELIDYLDLIPGSPSYDKFDESKFLKKFEDVCEKFDDPIPGETLIKVLNNVRKIEYYQNPNWYLYSDARIYDIFMESDWELRGQNMTEEQEVLYNALGVEYEKGTPFEIFNKYINKNDLPKDIEGVKLAKTLRLVLDKKKNSVKQYKDKQ